MAEKAKVFDKILKDYLTQVAAIKERPAIGTRLGVQVSEGGYIVPFFNRRYTITEKSIADEQGAAANHAVAVILCKYLLLCPQDQKGDDTLVTYKDFRDAAPYVIGFRNTAEQPIARSFTGKADLLKGRCRLLGGETFATEVACDLAFRWNALPKIPVFLLFNDADEEFPASGTLLFQKNAADYLDMECIAMIGSSLAAWLKKE